SGCREIFCVLSGIAISYNCPVALSFYLVFYFSFLLSYHPIRLKIFDRLNLVRREICSFCRSLRPDLPRPVTPLLKRIFRSSDSISPILCSTPRRDAPSP